MAIKVNPARRAFVVFNYVFCILVGLLCVIPVLHILAVSLSGKDAIIGSRVILWPVDTNFDNYRILLRDGQFFRSFRLTILRAVAGWCVSMIATVLASYPLSMKKSQFPARQAFVVYFMIIMLFNGGMIPTYLVIKDIGLLDTLWVLLLPCAVSTYNIILMINFMKALPEALSESAFIDGAGHFRTLFSIILPLCLPSIATISLFIVLSHWNAWFDGMIYITNENLKPLQTYLRSVLIVDSGVENLSLEDTMENVTADGANAAKIFVVMLPIMCVYPFLQKHFAKGIIRGSVKE